NSRCRRLRRSARAISGDGERGDGRIFHHHHAAGRFPLPTTEEWGEGTGEGIPISRANSMEGPLSPALSMNQPPHPIPLPLRGGEGARRAGEGAVHGPNTCAKAKGGSA